MRRIAPLSLFLLLVALAGCEESVDPTTDQLMGTWVASKIGAAFSGSPTLELEFRSAGVVVVTQAGEMNGTYATESDAAVSDIRNMTLAYGSNNLVGIYRITGNTMHLELVPSSTTNQIDPDPQLGIGGSGQENVSILVKQ